MRLPQAPCTEPAWALQTAKGTGPICEKPWENQVFERRGQEPNFFMFSQSFKGSSKEVESVMLGSRQIIGRKIYAAPLAS